LLSLDEGHISPLVSRDVLRQAIAFCWRTFVLKLFPKESSSLSLAFRHFFSEKLKTNNYMSAYLQEFLTPKQQIFCDEYLIDMNATRAALRAGYAKSVALNGQVMQMPKIKMYLESKMTDRAERCNYTADMVLRELGKIAFGNMRDYFDGEGNMKPMHLVDDDAKAALCSLSVTDAGSGSKKQSQGEVTKFRMYNKLAALDKIARHINFYKPDMKKEVVYRYLDKEQMEEEPWFENFKDELEERQESRCENQDFLETGEEDKIERQESRCENQDFL
jgi:phage terminase small subunit